VNEKKMRSGYGIEGEEQNEKEREGMRKGEGTEK